MLLVRLHNGAFFSFQRVLEDWLIGTTARLVFAGVLMVFFLNSARTKLGEGVAGLWNLDLGAYVQILPKAFESAGYDPANLDLFQTITVYAGTYAEILLPILIVAGLFTRLAALGMIGFIAVMTYVDIVAHEADPTAIGAWFDNLANAAIADQRSLWLFVLLVLVLKGPGPLSLDALFGRLVVKR